LWLLWLLQHRSSVTPASLNMTPASLLRLWMLAAAAAAAAAAGCCCCCQVSLGRFVEMAAAAGGAADVVAQGSSVSMRIMACCAGTAGHNSH